MDIHETICQAALKWLQSQGIPATEVLGWDEEIQYEYGSCGHDLYAYLETTIGYSAKGKRMAQKYTYSGGLSELIFELDNQ